MEELAQAAAGPDGGVATHIVPELPPLAWLVDLVGPRPVLFCGADVEVFGDGFFEGCWAGEFDDRGFDSAREVFGSGARLAGGEAVFVTPSHTADAVYALRRTDGFIVSNSIPFLVEFAGLELPYEFFIGKRFTSILRGIEAYERVVLEGPGWTLYRTAYQNFVVQGREIRWMPKQPAREPAFADYAIYRDFLLGTLSQVVRNGSAPSRKVRYSLITSCSSGYDSTACAALGTQLGCHQALSLRTARGINRPDSGRAAAAALGLELIEMERPPRARGEGFEEAEFFATGMGGEDYVFLSFGPHCRRKIFLSGFHGDIVWDRHAKPANTLARKDVSGSTLGELRLRHGFVQVPVPFIGATRHDDLLRIANSEEMRPYQVGSHYDRPLPRRIAEEQGVPRGSFADSKKAGSITFGYVALFWSRATLEDLKRFERRTLAEQGIARPYYAGWASQTGTQLGLVAAGKVAGKVGLSHWADQMLKRVPGADTLGYNHVRYGNMAFLWAVDKVRARYKRTGIARCLGR